MITDDDVLTVVAAKTRHYLNDDLMMFAPSCFHLLWLQLLAIAEQKVSSNSLFCAACSVGKACADAGSTHEGTYMDTDTQCLQ